MNVAQNIISHVIALITVISGIIVPNQTTIQQKTVAVTNPLSIESMRVREYPGSRVTIEQTLTPQSKYDRYIASYYSDGLKIYALLLVPNGQKPEKGWPVIIFNHGYIIPDKYTPDGNYASYTDAFAKNGYIVFKPDYRGHGKSDGTPTSAYFSPDYAVDNLNAIASIKLYSEANPDKIGVWGHSMGGNITLRDLVVNRKDIKAASIWAGVVGTYPDILYNWQSRVSYKPDAEDLYLRSFNKNMFIGTYGDPSTNPAFWASVEPNNFLEDITSPVQIQVGLSDTQVPPDFSTGLYERLKNIDKTVEYFEYKGSNHDINQNFILAMQRTIAFFDRYLK